ncbi:FecR domain-containing protein [Sphingopyxis sp. GW247-27LB]|jgi:transmembrane sensor|uniref:FecR family protein n=1 Tax=Sphingopyxis sp. GW247-27LB TaxID=2012632 RepID=UPI000BA69691|nr:FecR domain-containing protein [Sphingopyxis sp. GW247-27LB]PAL24287.1 iron dicitrate transport regulator FecR [Sphingopyxis sp. GW247-27LB]
MTRETASQIEDAAARWAARLDAGQLRADDERELTIWLANDDRRKGALLQAQAALSMLDLDEAVNKPTAQSINITRRWMLGGAAAAVAASAGFAPHAPGTIYRTQIGEIRRVPLSDGSTAAINTDSIVAIDLHEKERLVRLDRGEAWFQVAKDRTRPFLVEAGRVRVLAVGTAFSVRRSQDGVDVLVTEGVVEAWATGVEQHRVRIAAGSNAFIGDDAAIRQSLPEGSSIDRALAWRSGKIDLEGQPLSEAVAEFNRYNRRKLEVVDPTLAKEQFDGVFRTDDPAGFAAVVQTALGVPIDLSDADRIEIGSPRR